MKYLIALRNVIFAALFLTILLGVLHFPYDVDAPLTQQEIAAAARFGSTGLRYRRLTPNYEKYWVPDSDAVNSIDRHEAKLWFMSRGDECLNCEDALLDSSGPLIIRVHKSAS